jgi:hypothetical protein
VASNVIITPIVEAATKWTLDKLLESLKARFENKPDIDLEGIKRICSYLSSFKSKGQSFGETYKFPPPDPAVWSKESTTLQRIFGEWFYGAGLPGSEPPPESPVSAVLKQWLETLETADTLLWKGTSGHYDFEINDDPIKIAAKHKTIRYMYPFVILCEIEKDHPDDYLSSFVLLYINGWKAFLDEHTTFQAGNSLILNRMCYVEGDFFFNDVFYRDKDHNSELCSKPLALRRQMIVSETSSSLHICMTGVPYIQNEKPNKYHTHVARWLKHFQILKD